MKVLGRMTFFFFFFTWWGGKLKKNYSNVFVTCFSSAKAESNWMNRLLLEDKTQLLKKNLKLFLTQIKGFSLNF